MGYPRFHKKLSGSYSFVLHEPEPRRLTDTTSDSVYCIAYYVCMSIEIFCKGREGVLAYN